MPEIVEEEVVIVPVASEGGGCGSNGGGNSSISIFSIMIAMLVGFLYLRPRRA